MAKKGLLQSGFAHQLKGRSKAGGWALCVGAGISHPLFPSWDELVGRLITHEDPSRSSGENDELLNRLTKRFGPDALIEAARDRLGVEQEEFAEQLGEILYRDFKKKFATHWKLFARALSAASPADLLKWEWIDVLTQIRK